jgi:hypothetical protein
MYLVAKDTYRFNDGDMQAFAIKGKTYKVTSTSLENYNIIDETGFPHAFSIEPNNEGLSYSNWFFIVVEPEKTLTMNNLIANFNDAKKDNAKYVAIKIRMDGFDKDEIIINERENFDAKLEYYKETYDEYLNHKYSRAIKIVGFTFLERIEAVLIKGELIW